MNTQGPIYLQIYTIENNSSVPNFLNYYKFMIFPEGYKYLA